MSDPQTAETPPPSSPQVPDQARRVLEAAARCFAQSGFKSTTIDDIAREAGFSRPILYKYHRGKEALIDAVLTDLLGHWEAQLVEPEEFEFASEALYSKIVRAVGFASARPLLQAILRQEPRVLMSGHLEIFRRVNEASRKHSERIVRVGQESGEFSGDLDAARIAEAIEIVTFALCNRALGLRPPAVATRPEFDDQLVSQSATLLIRGLRAGHWPTPSSSVSGHHT